MLGCNYFTDSVDTSAGSVSFASSMCSAVDFWVSFQTLQAFNSFQATFSFMLTPWHFFSFVCGIFYCEKIDFSPRALTISSLIHILITQLSFHPPSRVEGSKCQSKVFFTICIQQVNAPHIKFAHSQE